MNWFIKIGGAAVIVAVFGLFLFILFQIFPLFRGARVEHVTTVTLPDDIPRPFVLGVDEWSELPFIVGLDGRFHFYSLSGEPGSITHTIEKATGEQFTALRYQQKTQEILFGSADGKVQQVTINYKPEFSDNGARRITANLETKGVLAMSDDPAPITHIDSQDSDTTRLVVAIQKATSGPRIRALHLVRKRSFLGAGTFAVKGRYDLTPLIKGNPIKAFVNISADAIIVATEADDVYFLNFENATFHIQQIFRPFDDLANPTIASMDFLLGKNSLCFTAQDGTNYIYSLYYSEKEQQLQWGHAKTFPALSGPSDFFTASLRNRAFLIGSGREVSLRFSTTEAIRWHETLNFTPRAAVISGKFNRFLILDESHRLHLYELDDPHPEAGYKAFFEKIRYEGQAEPTYAWQSSGATDEFEPKLSLIPLIFGSLKGTVYAMLFAVPIAFLAALYTARFLRPELKRFVKPTMEIMASLPSVVLGFLAALWLAPLIEDTIPSLFLTILAVPLVVLLLGAAWMHLPIDYRAWLKPGWEIALLAPFLLIGAYSFWHLGPVLEQLLFVVTDPETGKSVADFRLWWPQFTGASFDQRNSLVVGFIMGFAVIPLIFTITEDALSNVPPSLVSGSLALGASRWQTTRRIVLPTALPGIFSALMIGLGRAVGETMIVVMATGNTPIQEWNPFSGFRALSANIAVELPEAPQHGTLYRTLFLGAMVLFVLTFFVNTLAEIIRQRLREKYKVVG